MGWRFPPSIFIRVLFPALILRGYWIALNARDRFGSLLVVGITTLIAMQTISNIAVVTGTVPATGISLPFFSYGGTALMIQLAEMGVVLSVSRQMKAPPSSAGNPLHEPAGHGPGCGKFPSIPIQRG